MIAPPLEDVLEWVRAVLHRLLFLPEQASSAAPAIDDLQYAQFVFFWALGLVLFACTAWFALRYRRSVRGSAQMPLVESPLWLELGLAGGLLAAFLIFWYVGFRQYVEQAEAPEQALDVYVVARQWMWKFSYPDGPGSVGSLYVPRGRPVRLVLTSRDVIHSFFVPAFRVKQDAVPGRVTTLWFVPEREGRFPIYCSEYCGAGHSRMWGDVVVLPAERFAEWLDDAGVEGLARPLDEPGVIDPEGPEWPEPVGESMAERGVRVAADQGCLRCHTLDGTAHIGPTWLGLWRRREQLRDGRVVTADAAYLTRSMMDPQVDVVAGYAPLMPTYQGRLSPAETAAILELIRHLDHASEGRAPRDAAVPPELLRAPERP